MIADILIAMGISCLMFNGRQGDVINKGGYKISIPEMELYLQSLQGISEVAIITINDDIRGKILLLM